MKLNKLYRLIDHLDSTIVQQWNSLVDAYQEYKTSNLNRFDSVEDRVEDFEIFGIDDALDAIMSDPYITLRLSNRWSISEEDSDGKALYIRDNGALNTRYKLSAGE